MLNALAETASVHGISEAVCVHIVLATRRSCHAELERRFEVLGYFSPIAFHPWRFLYGIHQLQLDRSPEYWFKALFFSYIERGRLQSPFLDGDEEKPDKAKNKQTLDGESAGRDITRPPKISMVYPVFHTIKEQTATTNTKLYREDCFPRTWPADQE